MTFIDFVIKIGNLIIFENNCIGIVIKKNREEIEIFNLNNKTICNYYFRKCSCFNMCLYMGENVFRILNGKRRNSPW